MYKIQNLIVATTMVATMIITPIFADASIKDTNLGQSNGSKKLEAPKTQDTKSGGGTGTKTKPSKNKNNGNINTTTYNPMKNNESWGKNTYGEWQKVREWEEKPYIAKDILDFFAWDVWETNFNYNIKKVKIIDKQTKKHIIIFVAPRDGYYSAQAVEHRTKYYKKKKNTTYKRLKTSISYLGKIQTWEYKTESTHLDAGTKKYTKKPVVWHMYLNRGKNKIESKPYVTKVDLEVGYRLIK